MSKHGQLSNTVFAVNQSFKKVGVDSTWSSGYVKIVNRVTTVFILIYFSIAAALKLPSKY
jgi:hypothetical protein